MKRITAKYVVRLTFCLLMFFLIFQLPDEYTPQYLCTICASVAPICRKPATGAIRRNLETKQ